MIYRYRTWYKDNYIHLNTLVMIGSKIISQIKLQRVNPRIISSICYPTISYNLNNICLLQNISKYHTNSNTNTNTTINNNHKIDVNDDLERKIQSIVNQEISKVSNDEILERKIKYIVSAEIEKMKKDLSSVKCEQSDNYEQSVNCNTSNTKLTDTAKLMNKNNEGKLSVVNWIFLLVAGWLFGTNILFFIFSFFVFLVYSFPKFLLTHCCIL